MGERVTERNPKFDKVLKHIKNKNLKIRIWKQISKIIDNPEVGKPMRNVRKGTREVYITPFRISYAYIESENKIIFLDLYHKDKQ
ncbi:hypothetical protein CMO93_04155 [Candidatus Woesearchaeota archaeon]|nr:hypothetical protein [Candidatus Woesearchaeota archaeon]|tara:strand:- start:388 stop:642 length:255 start_codon:yes stop_codon:yes gene_type:complete